eukprot:359384-Chlamydomonas_euryale.AAC.3
MNLHSDVKALWVRRLSAGSRRAREIKERRAILRNHGVALSKCNCGCALEKLEVRRDQLRSLSRECTHARRAAPACGAGACMGRHGNSRMECFWGAVQAAEGPVKASFDSHWHSQYGCTPCTVLCKTEARRPQATPLSIYKRACKNTAAGAGRGGGEPQVNVRKGSMLARILQKVCRTRILYHLHSSNLNAAVWLRGSTAHTSLQHLPRPLIEAARKAFAVCSQRTGCMEAYACTQVPWRTRHVGAGAAVGGTQAWVL